MLYLTFISCELETSSNSLLLLNLLLFVKDHIQNNNYFTCIIGNFGHMYQCILCYIDVLGHVRM